MIWTGEALRARESVSGALRKGYVELGRGGLGQSLHFRRLQEVFDFLEELPREPIFARGMTRLKVWLPSAHGSTLILICTADDGYESARSASCEVLCSAARQALVDLGATSRGGADRRADGGERRVGVLTQGGNGADADHDDQGQHDRVLDGRRAVFTLQELNHEVAKLTHVGILHWISKSDIRCTK